MGVYNIYYSPTGGTTIFLKSTRLCLPLTRVYLEREIMITDKQFEDAFTTAGGWFFLTQYEIIINWNDTKSTLVDELFKKGFDSKRTGTNTRVASILRIIESKRDKEALMKIRDSKSINRQHPEAFDIATELIKKYH